MTRIPPDAFAYYLGLGVSRSYQAVAGHFGVSKTAVVHLAAREDWCARLRQAEKRVADAAEKKAVETIEQTNDRHIRSLKAIQGKALEALKSHALGSAFEAVMALALAAWQMRPSLPEPGPSGVPILVVGDREWERRWS